MNTLKSLSVVVFAAAIQLANGAEPLKELTSLKSSWQKARSSSIAPIDKKYRDMLATLRLKYSREANQEALSYIDLELKSLDDLSSLEKLTPQTEVSIQAPHTDFLMGSRRVMFVAMQADRNALMQYAAEHNLSLIAPVSPKEVTDLFEQCRKIMAKGDRITLAYNISPDGALLTMDGQPLSNGPELLRTALKIADPKTTMKKLEADPSTAVVPGVAGRLGFAIASGDTGAFFIRDSPTNTAKVIGGLFQRNK